MEIAFGGDKSCPGGTLEKKLEVKLKSSQRQQWNFKELYPGYTVENIVKEIDNRNETYKQKVLELVE